MTPGFVPTHRITFVHDAARPTEWVVMLTDTGEAPTERDWSDGLQPAWLRNADGEWRYDGNLTPGNRPGDLTIEPLS